MAWLLAFAFVAGVEGVVVPGADEAFCTDFGAMGGRGSGRQRDQIYAWVGEQRGMRNVLGMNLTSLLGPPRPFEQSIRPLIRLHGLSTMSPVTTLRRVCPLYLTQASIVLMVYATIATSYTSHSSCNLPIRQPIRLRSSTRGQICPASIHADVNGSHT